MDGMPYPMLSRTCHTRRRPWAGHGAMMPFSVETLVRKGPRKLGQSLPVFRVQRSGGSSTDPAACTSAVFVLLSPAVHPHDIAQKTRAPNRCFSYRRSAGGCTRDRRSIALSLLLCESTDPGS